MMETGSFLENQPMEISWRVKERKKGSPWHQILSPRNVCI